MKTPHKKISLFIINVLLVGLTFSTVKANNSTLLPNEEDYKIAVDQTPTPIGGYENVFKKVTYPDMAIKTQTSGKVYMLVYLDEKGDVDEVKIVKGIGAGCDEEAMKAVRKSKFTPATQNGAPVKTKFAIALNFKLP